MMGMIQVLLLVVNRADNVTIRTAYGFSQVR